MSQLLLLGDALRLPLADENVQCCITSPPYWGLRDYGVDGQIGLEATSEEYVSNLVAVFREVWRVLRTDGVVWLNLGDSYAGSTDGILKPKDLCMIPARVALALQADGWWLRSDIIWSKPNSMTESVTDRPTKSHEYIFLLSKSINYFYDADAVREPANSPLTKLQSHHDPTNPKYKSVPSDRWLDQFNGRVWGKVGSRNRRTVWTIATQPYSGAHFATFPIKLVEPMVLAGSRPGDLVLDPFAGTATVGRVCIQHRRNFIGIDIKPEYLILAQQRTSGVQVALPLPATGDER